MPVFYDTISEVESVIYGLNKAPSQRLIILPVKQNKQQVETPILTHKSVTHYRWPFRGHTRPKLPDQEGIEDIQTRHFRWLYLRFLAGSDQEVANSGRRFDRIMLVNPMIRSSNTTTSEPQTPAVRQQ